jgi:hypothetical protein
MENLDNLTFEQLIDKIDFTQEEVKLDKPYLFIIECLAERTHKTFLTDASSKLTFEEIKKGFIFLFETKLKELEVVTPKNHEKIYKSILNHFLEKIHQHHHSA